MERPTHEILRQWIRDHGPMCLKIAESFTQDPDEAKDIVQEAWVVALEKAHLRRPGVPIGPWLYKVTYNIARAETRKHRKRRSLLQDWAAAHREPVEYPQWREAILQRRLWGAIARLPRLQQDAVLLRIVEGMSTAQAAQALNRSEGTVKGSLWRAIKTLKKEFREDWDEATESLAGKTQPEEDR